MTTRTKWILGIIPVALAIAVLIGVWYHSNSAIRWYQKGEKLFRSCRFEEAIKSFDEAIKINPKYKEAWLEKGFVLGRLGRNEEEIQAYDEALKIDPKYAVAWSIKGIVLKYLGRYDEAIKSFDEAVKIDPKRAMEWYIIACTYSLKKDKINALRALTKTIILFNGYKGIAKKDEAFKWLWEDEEFKKITQ